MVEVHHPGLRSILDLLRRGQPLTDNQLAGLHHQFQMLEEREHIVPSAAKLPEATTMPARAEGMLASFATSDGCARFTTSFGEQAFDFYREAQGLQLSSVGIGTYRGPMDHETDEAYIATITAALRAGINVIDTSLNYRHQRSERCVAIALRKFIEENGGSRSSVFVCTKGGYLVPGAMPDTSLFTDDQVGSAHSLAPAFLIDQIERSRRNLGLEGIDVYYLHNPEVQLQFVDGRTFMRRMRQAFVQLERAASDGLIKYYGVATWDGFFDGSLSLRSLEALARQIAGKTHRFRFVQLPVNLGMLDILRSLVDDQSSVLGVAQELGMTVIASASLLQGRVARDLPSSIARVMPTLATDAQCAIQFVRSTPGVTSALVGMRCVKHVADNVGLAATSPLSPEQYDAVLSSH